MQNQTHGVCDDKPLLVAFLYDECEAAERDRIQAHLATCAGCRTELDALRAVRGRLAEWAPPEPAPDFRVVPAAAVAERRAGWREVRALALAAAAVLVLAVGAGIANVEVRYDRDGLVVRTGWSEAAPVAAADAASESPWRTELAEVASELRREFTGGTAAGTPRQTGAARAGAESQPGLGRVQRLIEESERRQQRNLALRFAQLSREAEAQRQADLLRIEQQVGQLEGLTEAEVVQHNEIMDYLVRVAGR